MSTQYSVKPGEETAKWIHTGTKVLLPGALPGTHDGFKAVGEPYESGGEWWVEVVEEHDRDGEPFPIGLHAASLPW